MKCRSTVVFIGLAASTVMRRRLLALVTSVIIGMIPSLSTAQSDSFDLFGTTASTSFANPNTLLRLDPSTGAQTLAGPVGLAVNARKLAWNPITKKLFGSDIFDNPGVIQEIDPITGISIPIATIRESGNPVLIGGLAFTSNGTLWGVAGLNPAAGHTLGVIDLSTEAFSPRLSLPGGLWVPAIAISTNSLLYAITASIHPAEFQQNLVTIDLATMSILSDRNLNSQFNIDDITLAPDGFIYHTNSSAWLFRIDPEGATVTAIGFDNLGAMGGIASTVVAAEPPPPPSFVDLDIQFFRVAGPGAVRESCDPRPRTMRISLGVRNSGQVDAPRLATVIGVQSGSEVYRSSLLVSAPIGGGVATWRFPDFVRTSSGPIRWTAVIADDDPDEDVAVVFTGLAGPSCP